MRPYRFYGLVQGCLLQLQLALFILVKVISPLGEKTWGQRVRHQTANTHRDRETAKERETVRETA
jgi:hypothetical protein